MAFLYFYDLVDFDDNGRLVETKKYKDIHKVESNFLYLVAKYNQQIFKAENKDGQVLPDFFKEDFSELLREVESGKSSKEYALRVTANNCQKSVKEIISSSKSDREIVTKLSSLIELDAKNYAKKFKSATSKKQLEYIITCTAGNLMTDINTNIREVDKDKKIKSMIYKKIISYNGLVETVASAERMQALLG